MRHYKLAHGKEPDMNYWVAKDINCDMYFSKLNHSWAMGQNENANHSLCQYFTKRMELINVTGKQIFKTVHKLNSRLRKYLEIKTPYYAFKEAKGMKVKNLLGYINLSFQSRCNLI